jgi:hypothetical protein
MPKLHWESPPGGKRYRATYKGRIYEVVKQNTAAGATPWRANVRLASGVTYRIANTQKIGEAKRAAENWIPE